MFCRLEEPVEDIVDDVEHGPVAAKVRHQGIDASTTRSNFLHHSFEGFDVGSAEGIDRLLGIPHDKQFARLQVHVMPRSLMAARPFTEVEDDLVLDRIGVLKLIDQDRPIGLFDPSADGRMVAQEGFGPCQQPIECDPPGGEKPMTYLIEEGSYERHHLLKV